MSLDTGINCLVVDDQLVAIKKVVKNLKALGLEKVSQAKDGVEAYAIFEEAISKGEPFGIVISDLNMPNMNGIELVQKIREHGSHGSTPFLMVTAETEQSKIAEAVQAGVNNYIIKPFEPEDLEDKIKKIFEMQQAG